MKSGVDLPFLFIPAKYAFRKKVLTKKPVQAIMSLFHRKEHTKMMNRSSILCCSDTSSVVSFVRRASYAAKT